MLQRLSSLAVRSPRRIAFAWLAVVIAGVAAAGILFSDLEADLDAPTSRESARVDRELDRLDPGGGEIVAVAEVNPLPAGVTDGLTAIPGVAGVRSLPSDDGRATGIAVELDPHLGDDRFDAAVGDVTAALRAIDAPRVLVGGELLLDEEIGDQAEQDAQRAEALSLPAALVVMALVLGGVLVAGLPVAIALGGVGATMLGLLALSALTGVPVYAVNVATMLGIGLGIDYGLLMVSRFREERGAGRPVPEAVARTMATAGRTVVFSACTVAVALSGLLVFDDPTIRALALAGMGVVLACMAAALTLLPALLARFGHRIGPARPAGPRGGFARLARMIQRRPVPVVAAVAAGLVLLAVPFASARFDDTGVRSLPRSSETRQVAEAIDTRFSAVTAEPVVVLAEVDPGDPAVAGWLDDVRSLPGVVAATASPDLSRPGLTVVEVHAAGRSNGPRAQVVVEELRALDAPFPVAVGGDPAEIVDFRHAIASRLPLAIAVMLLATFALLFAMTRSVVLPVKAIVMNVLSLGATFGALVWVFQDGHLSGVLGFDPPGSLDLVIPVIVFVFAFGLSMDYEVFLLDRIREVWRRTGDNDRAVAEGLQRSGRIITSAALLVVIVFAGFAAGEIVALKQLGVGLAVAVAVDATVVRSLLVPATMKLMGRWNWWSPFGRSEPGAAVSVPAPGSEPVAGPGVGDLVPGVAQRPHGDAAHQQLAPDAMALQAHE
jgi:RND superfamily putative drug exporter